MTDDAKGATAPGFQYTHPIEFIGDLLNEQAKDEGLWFVAKTAPEAYLQQELRKMHAAAEAIVDAYNFWKQHMESSDD